MGVSSYYEAEIDTQEECIKLASEYAKLPFVTATECKIIQEGQAQ